MFFRVVARPLLQKVNATMGTPVVKAVPDLREALKEAYKKSLNDAKGIPEENAYRKSLETFVGGRLKIVEEEHDVKAIENRIGVGPIEDIIAEARADHAFISGFIEFEPWVEEAVDKLGEARTGIWYDITNTIQHHYFPRIGEEWPESGEEWPESERRVDL